MKIKSFIPMVLFLTSSLALAEVEIFDLTSESNYTNTVTQSHETTSGSPTPNTKERAFEPLPFSPPPAPPLSLEQRILRLEKQIENLVGMNLPARLDTMQQEMQKINGQTEQNAHSTKVLNDQIRDFYKDLEKRINQIQNENTVKNEPITNKTETKGKLVSAGSTLSSKSSTLPSAPNASSEIEQQSLPKEQKAYEDAFILVQQKKYSAATLKLKSYIKSYPNGAYIVNAHYWIAECYYLLNRLNEAALEFKSLASKYPSATKAPDALLKLGIIYNLQGKTSLARQKFEQIKTSFPKSSAAKIAKQQLQQLNISSDYESDDHGD